MGNVKNTENPKNLHRTLRNPTKKHDKISQKLNTKKDTNTQHIMKKHTKQPQNRKTQKTLENMKQKQHRNSQNIETCRNKTENLQKPTSRL